MRVQMDSIVNKVAESDLLSIDLEELHQPGERTLFDIRSWLYEEQILKEKDFREKIKQHDWSTYQDRFVAVTCTADAIVPTWAYMLLASALTPFARKVVFGSLERLEEELYFDKLESLDLLLYKDRRVVVKGCSKVSVPTAAYVRLTTMLRPTVKSLMYGEPCSTVPVYKRREEKQ